MRDIVSRLFTRARVCHRMMMTMRSFMYRLDAFIFQRRGMPLGPFGRVLESGVVVAEKSTKCVCVETSGVREKKD